MADDSYLLARAEVAELLRVFSRLNDSENHLYEHLQRDKREQVEPALAVATRLVALLTKSMEVPSYPFIPVVVAPNGRLIRVALAEIELTELECGAFASLDYKHWDEFALVAFEQGMPKVVHIIDREQLGLIAEFMKVGDTPICYRPGSCGVLLSLMFHYNVMLEPVLADVLGIRTFVLDESDAVGWSRVGAA